MVHKKVSFNPFLDLHCSPKTFIDKKTESDLKCDFRHTAKTFVWALRGCRETRTRSSRTQVQNILC